MKKNISVSPSVSMIALIAILSSVGLGSHAFAYTQLSGQLDQGQSNNDVTSLQTFLADNTSLYPEGFVTGYFGSLTANAVRRFQAQYGFEQVGRVGPMTLSKINSLIASGGWTMSDISGPSFSNVAMNQSSNTATFMFNTNENTSARVVFNTSPLRFNEGDINSNGFGVIGGSGSAASASSMTNTHSITINGLQPNTVYYYTVIATDASGNVSMVGPNNTFRTNN